MPEHLAIELLQDAAQRGDLDPWDVDVIAVVDGFLDQLRQRIEVPRQVHAALQGRGGSYERDLADSSEAFLAASVLVGLKAELLEAQTFPPEPVFEEGFEAELGDQGWLDPDFNLPRRPERHLERRPVAPPPLRRPVTLGELIEQLESIAEQLETDELEMRRRQKKKRFSNREAIAQVAALAHREKLPETTAALGVFLQEWEEGLHWTDFEQLVLRWCEVAPLTSTPTGLACSGPALSLLPGASGTAAGGISAWPLQLKRLLAPGSMAQLPITRLEVPAVVPAGEAVAA